ncbi:hypothetical protein BJV85_003882 [Clostridium acetobutylicum]|nr:hypothetical protein [Clostridium acetobutylicum]NOW16404.1 hypothetical protein [Clostridium acetobutylicum]NRY58674.1 hypothetical protein [Clostridium acetobutylicum]NSA94935.1 hypothetical protein [Clostridium acetobutylicum]NYC96031.1 hypothetical protein [Clostridium acetobutylicum]
MLLKKHKLAFSVLALTLLFLGVNFLGNNVGLSVSPMTPW